MTALCGGGTSSAKSGIPSLITFTAAAITAALEKYLPHDMALFLAPFLWGTSVEVTSFCAADPPAMPTLGVGDFLALASFLDPIAHTAAVNKLTDWFVATYWCDICKCDNGTVPDCSPTIPTGDPVGTNVGLPSGGVTGHCFESQPSLEIQTVTGTWQEYSDVFLPTSTGSHSTTGSAPVPNGTGYLIPTGATSWGYDLTALKSGDALDFELAWFNSSFAYIASTAIYNSNPSQPDHQAVDNIPIHANAVYWRIGEYSGVTGHTIPLSGTFWVNCGSGTTTLSSPCCDPDPSIDSRLNQILATLNSIWASIPAPLTSYAEGTAHTSLSGNGSFSLSAGALALKLDVTTIPASRGRYNESPVYYFDLGYITPAGAEGAYSTAPVTKQLEVMPLPALSTTVYYSLTPGVVATITELTRGP